MVIDDLKKLSNEAIGIPSRNSESSTPLHEFFDEYPVLFVALRAVFALLPSASRIVESAHGIVRHIYNSQVPQEWLNAMLRYKMSIAHDMNEARKKVVRQKGSRGDNSNDEPKKRKAAKDCDRLETVEMLGSQLKKLQCEGRYSDVALLKKPPHFQEKIKLGNINKTSAHRVEEHIKKLKKEQAEQLRERRTKDRDEKSIAEFQDIATNALTEHDKGWSDRDAREEMAIVSEMLKKTFWRSVPASDFFIELANVIPTFDSKTEGKISILKKGAKADLGAHLEAIKTISKDEKKNNTISDTDLSELSEDEIVKHFVRHEESQFHASSNGKKESDKKKLQAVFKHFGTDLSTRARFTSEYTYDCATAAKENASKEDDNEEGEEEAEHERIDMIDID